MASKGIVWDNPLPRNIDSVYPQLTGYLEKASAFKATDIEGWMKRNAPWTDQTSNARNGLSAEAYSESGHFGIRMSHGVPYGVWLEVRFSGRYSILTPALEVKGPEFMKLLNNVLAKVKAGL